MDRWLKANWRIILVIIAAAIVGATGAHTVAHRVALEVGTALSQPAPQQGVGTPSP